MQIDSIAGQGSYVAPIKTNASEGNDVDRAPEVAVAHVSEIKGKTQLSTQKAEFENQKMEHEIIQAIERANKHIRTYDRRLEFTIHDLTKQIMVKVINTEDDSVIREIPSEKVLDMVAHMWEVAGILVDEKR